MSLTILDKFLWDFVRGQKRAKVQEFSSSWVSLFDFLKRERPGCRHRVWIVGALRTTSS
jgi:hypothetical protein